MGQLVDIHCHILPGIDDGPRDMEGAMLMARAAVAAGIGTVAATPHLRSDFPQVKVDEIAGRCAELQSLLDAEGVPLRIVPGGEVSLGWALEAGDEALRMASYGQRGTDVLIETPITGGLMLPTLISQVAARGYRVVLAHPERLVDFQETPAILERIAAQRILLQVNADGVLGSPRKSRSAKLAHHLCRQGLVSVIASDGHRGSEHRPIGRLAEAEAVLPALVSSETAPFLVHEVPAAILAGDPIPSIPHAAPQPARRPFWRRGRGAAG